MAVFGRSTTTQDVLIATLGTEPQVVSAAHTLLQHKGYAIKRVIVLHTHPRQEADPIAQSVQRLHEHYRDWEAGSFEAVPLYDQYNLPVQDVVSPAGIDAVFRSIFTVVAGLKQEEPPDVRMHLLVAGGRKTMSMFGMLVAQLLFDEEDLLWHLYSAGEYLRERRMVPQEADTVELVSVPVIRWSAIPPRFFNLYQYEDPYEALQRVQEMQFEQKLNEARIFLNQELTPRRRDVAVLISQSLTNPEIAEQLVIEVHTVNSHVEQIFDSARDFWQMEEMDRGQLAKLLGLYVDIEGVDSFFP